MDLLSEETKQFYYEHFPEQDQLDRDGEDHVDGLQNEAVVTKNKKKLKKKQTKKKGTQMHPILGDLNVNDFYPGMKYNKFPTNVKYLPGFGPHGKEEDTVKVPLPDIKST